MSNKNRIERRYTKWGYIFVIPFVVVFLIFSFWPMASTVYYAFCYLKHAGNTNPEWLTTVGKPWYQNFKDVFTAKSFWDALRNTLLFFISSTIPEWLLAFWLAVMMTDRRMKIRGRFVWKTAFFFPKLVAGSALGYSVLDHILTVVGQGSFYTIAASMMNGFGFKEKDFEFLTSVQFFIILTAIFMHFGITFIYAVAGITGIPVEVFEAAEIDGANRLQTFFKVTLPSMRPMLFFITVVSVVDGIGMYDIPNLFGPFDTFRRNLTLMMYMEKQAFAGSYAYDKASAASLVLLLIYILMSGIIYFLFLRDRDEAKLRKLNKQKERELARSI